MRVREILLRGAVTGLALGVFVIFIGGAFITGLNKEEARQEFIKVDNCKKYGPAINKLAGSEVCPPTENG